MGQAKVKPIYTLAEYYSLDRVSNTRHEYWCGEIYAMAGGSPLHARLIGQMTTMLNTRLAETSCYAAPSDQRVRAEADDLNTYPDVVVMRDDAQFDPMDAHTLLDPRVIVEVLSPSTQAYDCDSKLAIYQRIASLSDILIVWQDCVRVEHHTRDENGWQMRSFVKRDDTLRLANFEVELPLQELYRRLDLPEGNASNS